MEYNQQGGIFNQLATPKGTREHIFREIKEYSKKGLLHILYNKYLRYLGHSSNIILPYYNEYNMDRTEIVIINNPEDAERISEDHIKKTPYLKPYVYESIISTTDSDHWKIQRRT